MDAIAAITLDQEEVPASPGYELTGRGIDERPEFASSSVYLPSTSGVNDGFRSEASFSIALEPLGPATVQL